MIRLTILLTLLLAFTQTNSQNHELEIYYGNKLFKVPASEFHNNFYFSLTHFAEQLSLPFKKKNNSSSIEINFPASKLTATAGVPFLILKKNNNEKERIFQLPVSIISFDDDLFIPVEYSITPLSNAFGKKVYLTGKLKLEVREENLSEQEIVTLPDENSRSEISKILVYEKSGGVVVKLFSENKININKSFYNKGEFKIILYNAYFNSKNIELNTDLVYNVRTIIKDNNLEVTLITDFDYLFSDIMEIPGTNDIAVLINVQPDPYDWYKSESEHFTVIYRESHSTLVPYIIRSAENSLKMLMSIFDYQPSEKIIINTYDVSDYGFGATTTIPQNYIRIEIEPLEPGYENIPYNERLQWLISHELVHIVVNDQASGIEKFSRKIFQKVTPEQYQPITVFYSILTNYSRYTPRWHQEAVAVFLETWMSGGFGRILGNFDEMYFRSMVLEEKEFPNDLKLDAVTTHNSFLIETLFYLYGARFAAYLALRFDSQKLIDWFKISSEDFYHSFKNKFEIVFNEDFDDVWNDFIVYEKEFQQNNIKKLKSSEITYLKKLIDNTFGFATQPHFDPVAETILFGYHKPHHLASILKLDLESLNAEDIASLPTPSQFQVASTAFDYNTGLFFYTTNNNQLYRDVLVLDIETGENKILFKDARIGNLTVSPLTHDLWGIKHSVGKASIIYSPYPYNTIQQLTEFPFGHEIQQMSINPSGKYLAATILNNSGEQSIVIISADSLLNSGKFISKVITKSGTPENPSWSFDGKTLYWNAFTNGVSNIYKTEFTDDFFSNSAPVAVSHTLRGLFKPIEIGDDLLFAFEFTSEGLLPVVLENNPAEVLPAINYLGQEVIKKNSNVYNWYVNPSVETSSLKIKDEEEEYNSLANLKIQTFIPVITGFQKQKVLGIYTHISDPMLNHDISIEAGYSPFNENPFGPKWHFKGKYEYKKQWQVGIEHNAPDFYDLFNERKRGLIGSKFSLGYTYYWLYDNPLKIKQQSEAAYYTNLIFLNDNLTPVSEPDFGTIQTNFNSRNLRRTIGSSDYEYGDEFSLTLLFFGTEADHNFEYVGQVYGEWDHFTTFFFNHNVFHFKLGAGYLNNNEKLFQGRFFFGGFGNRALENVDVKQYRKVFRFPGLPIYSLDTDRFIKVMIENNLPPLRFSSLGLGNHYLSHLDFAVYTQALYTKSPLGEKLIDLGAQVNLIFKHWFNLESTLSAGIANAWFKGGEDWEWFISFKLLKN